MNLLIQLLDLKKDELTSDSASKMIIELSEIASLVTWVASEECSFTTAGVFDISGGRATY